MNTTQIRKQIQAARDSFSRQVEQLDKALEALNGVKRAYKKRRKVRAQKKG